MPLKLAEIKQMSHEDLQEELKKSRLELATLRMKFASRQLDNPSLIKKSKKEIARILTVQTQKLKEKPEEKVNEQESKKADKSKKLERRETEKQEEKLKKTVKEETKKKRTKREK